MIYPKRLAYNLASQWGTRNFSIVSQKESTLTVRFDDQSLGKFHYVWLRDHCQCPLCIHSSNKQKLHSSGDIPLDIKPRLVEADRSVLRIEWPTLSSRKSKLVDSNEQIHSSLYDISWLHKEHNLFTNSMPVVQPILWNKRMASQLQRHDYSDFVKGHESISKANAGQSNTYIQVIKEIHDYGLSFLKNVPTDLRQVEIVAKAFGCIRETFYGSSWDVKSVSNSKNIAYTSLYLGLHMDLM